MLQEKNYPFYRSKAEYSTGEYCLPYYFFDPRFLNLSKSAGSDI